MFGTALMLLVNSRSNQMRRTEVLTMSALCERWIMRTERQQRRRAFPKQDMETCRYVRVGYVSYSVIVQYCLGQEETAAHGQQFPENLLTQDSRISSYEPASLRQNTLQIRHICSYLTVGEKQGSLEGSLNELHEPDTKRCMDACLNKFRPFFIILKMLWFSII